jgi:CPA1 family monovalent cation:H+ antiporter
VGDLQIVIAALFVSAAGLNAIANWLQIPYPIPLVLGGLVLGLVPGIPHVQLNPDLVLLVFLPPLLYSSAFFVDLRSLREDARVIALSAIGLVLATAVAVAVVGHQLIGLSWAMSFALGAIVAPTDPAAATAIMRRVGAPRRLVNILEGESLFNDATALVAYKVAVAAAVGGSISAGDTVLEFFRDAGGGIAIGLVVGWAIGEVRKRVSDINTELTISLFSAYGAFVPADQLGVSGVLAVVACGVYLGFRAPEIASPEARMQAYGLWTTIAFLLNAVLFILIGLQLPVIVDELAGRPPGEVLGYAAAVCATVIAVRLLWNFIVTFLIRAIDRRPSQRARRAGWRVRVVGSWAGMRGAVSLAAALALPLRTEAGAPLPGRELIQFITFALILVTVVGQGLTLPWLIRRLGVIEDGTEEENEELRARLVIARAALERVDELENEDWTRDGTVERVRRLYEFRRRRFKIRAGKIADEDGLEESSLAYQRMMHEIYTAQRQALVGLRNSRQISGEVMRRVERELDLEESRLEV